VGRSTYPADDAPGGEEEAKRKERKPADDAP
jgi:hypothetical protein